MRGLLVISAAVLLATLARAGNDRPGVCFAPAPAGDGPLDVCFALAPTGDDCPAACFADHCIFDGIRNEPLGDATLSITDECKLRVENVGAGGGDGVAQTELASLYMAMTLSTPNFSLSGPGTAAGIRQLGVVDGLSDGDVMFTRIINTDGDHLHYSVECPDLYPSNYIVRIFEADTLVAEQQLGPKTPALSFPKVDMNWMSCGLLDGGDAYGVLDLAAPRPITVLDVPPEDAGPFVGNVIFVEALGPSSVATLQERIDEHFTATGPVEIEAMLVLDSACPPGEVTGVQLDGSAPTQIHFDSQDDLAGPSTSYRVLTGLLSELKATDGFALSECLGEFAEPPVVDNQPLPPSGDGYYYLIGGRTICPMPGPGTYGDSTIEPDPRNKVDELDPCATP